MEWALFLGDVPVGGALACGFAIGWLICFTGVGGGVLVIPALTFFFGLPVSAAVGTASVYTALTKIMAGAEHVRIGNVDYAMFAKITGAALPGLVAAAAAINYLLASHPDSEAQVQEALRLAVIAAIVISLLLIVVKKRPAALPRGAAAGGGLGIGLMMGATGIGGGVLIAPALLLLGCAPAKRVVGTSILIALVLSGLTALLYAAGGQVVWAQAFWMAAGSLLATPLASRALRRVSEAAVQRSLLLLILVAVLLMLGSG